MLVLGGRFWDRVQRRADNECWLWTGSKAHGHGQIKIDGRVQYAHRVLYETMYGPVPGLEVDHQCRNRACVNPMHLRAATRKQNAENLGGAVARNPTGVRGVHMTPRGRYRVTVRHWGKNHNGGAFASLDEAEQAAIALRTRLFTYNDADRTE